MKRYSLHIGVNRCDPGHYNGWEGRLACCERDARAMAELTRSLGFSVRELHTLDATRASVIDSIGRAAKTMAAEDLFVVSYSGHGGQLPDTSGDERDKIDETWCLYDAQLLDDELYVLWSQFQPGVRIVVLSDSCHSGTVVRNDPPDTEAEAGTRFMPREIAVGVYAKNKSFYDQLQSRGTRPSEPVAGVLLLSGCRDDQYSYESWGHGRFTNALLETWSEGAFDGSYEELHAGITRTMPTNPEQNPQLTFLGNGRDAFVAAQAFR